MSLLECNIIVKSKEGGIYYMTVYEKKVNIEEFLKLRKKESNIKCVNIETVLKGHKDKCNIKQINIVKFLEENEVKCSIN